MNRSGWIALLVAAVGWGTGGIATRAAYGVGVEPWTMVTARVFIAAALVVGVLAIQGIRRPDALTLRIGVVMATVNLFLPYVVFTFAYDEASAGFVGLFAALIPLSTAVYVHFMLDDERLNGMKVFGLLTGFTGVAALLASGDSGLGAEGRPLVAAGLAIVGVVVIGFAGAYAKRYAGRYDPLEITGLQFLFSAVALVPLMFWLEGVPTAVAGSGWALIAYMAVASTFLPFYLYYRLLESVPATTVSLVGYVVPFVALFGGDLFLGERIEPGIVLGGALIVAGMVITDRAGRASSG